MNFKRSYNSGGSAAAVVDEQRRLNPDPVYIPLDSIQLDSQRFRFRVETDPAQVAKLQDLIKAGVDLEPVEVFEIEGQSGLWLVHGYTRYTAVQALGQNTILAIVRQGTLLDAMKIAWSANSKHGRQLTDADKRLKIASYLEFYPQASDTQIANAINVSATFVGDERKKMVKAGAVTLPTDENGNEIRMVTRKGKTYAQKVGKIGTKKPKSGNGKVSADERGEAISFPVDPGKAKSTYYVVTLDEDQAVALRNLLKQHSDQQIARFVLSKLI